jgi:hypothetical protein
MKKKQIKLVKLVFKKNDIVELSQLRNITGGIYPPDYTITESVNGVFTRKCDTLGC